MQYHLSYDDGCLGPNALLIIIPVSWSPFIPVTTYNTRVEYSSWGDEQPDSNIRAQPNHNLAGNLNRAIHHTTSGGSEVFSRPRPKRSLQVRHCHRSGAQQKRAQLFKTSAISDSIMRIIGCCITHIYLMCSDDWRLPRGAWVRIQEACDDAAVMLNNDKRNEEK